MNLFNLKKTSSFGFICLNKLIRKKLSIHVPVYNQCLKWTVAQSPNATNILFGRPKAAPN